MRETSRRFLAWRKALALTSQPVTMNPRARAASPTDAPINPVPMSATDSGLYRSRGIRRHRPSDCACDGPHGIHHRREFVERERFEAVFERFARLRMHFD